MVISDLLQRVTLPEVLFNIVTGMFSTTASSRPGDAFSVEQCDTMADPLTDSDKCDSPHLEEVKVSRTLSNPKSCQTD